MAPDIRKRVSSTLGFKEVLSHDKYLGLPTSFKRSKKLSFSCIKDRVWKKLQGWKEKLLSKAGKEILIKAVAQSIPTYSMSCFKLLNTFCEDIERIIRQFWWGTSSSDRGISWKAWSELCRPKCEGGLGFRDLKIFNLSLLAKQFWRIHEAPCSLLARVLKARYFPTTTIWEARCGPNPSYTWRSICSARSVLEQGVRWRVGDGKSISLWDDAWIDGKGTGKLISPRRILNHDAKVEAILDLENGSWKMDLIKETLLPIDVDRICKIPLSRTGAKDERYWMGSEDDIFRVRDMYSMALHNQFETQCSTGSDPIWHKVWRLNIHPKAKIFLWRALWDILPHGSNLRKKGIEGVDKCQRCGSKEDNAHVLRDCSWARQVWAQMTNFNSFPPLISFREWFAGIISQRSTQEVELVGVYTWQIWSARNDLMFNKVYVTPELCFKRPADMLMEYRKANSSQSLESSNRDKARWIPPAAGFLKINVDAAVSSKDDKIGFGLVARNSAGEVIMTAAKSAWPFCTVERAELQAFEWATELAIAHNWDRVILEGDAQLVVNALNGKVQRGNLTHVVILNIQAAATKIPSVVFNFCYREANTAAHRLAKCAVSNMCSFVRLDSGPPWIKDLVCLDLIS